MNTDEGSRNPDSTVQFRIWDAVVSIGYNTNGEIVAEGEPSDALVLLAHYIRENSFRGCTRSDALKVAFKIAKHFSTEIPDLYGVRASIRGAWIRLLKTNLMGEPAQTY